MICRKLTLILSSFLFFIFINAVHAQIPQNFNYQGVLRDANGEIQANETVDVRFTVLNNGNSVFTETHSGISTNDFGLINLKIGTVNTTDFSNIDWSSGTKELQVEVDAGNGFENLGSSNLVSVPYALRAGTAASADISLDEINNVNTSGASSGDYLQWDGTEWVPAAGAGGGTPSGPAGGDLNGTYPNPQIGSNVISTSNIDDDAITADKLAQMGASSGDILQWNGTGWATAAAPGGSNWSVSGNDLYYNSGYVGIGTNSPSYTLDISSGTETAVQVTSASTTNNMTVEIENTAGTGLGVAVGSTLGVAFPGTPTGVYVNADNGYQGVYSASTDETAIFGQTDNGGDAIEGYVFAGNGHSGYFHGGSGVLVEDGLETDELQLTQGAASDYLLQSDANGNASWVNPSNISDGDWTKSGNDIYKQNGNVGIGTNSPSAKLQIAAGSIIAQYIQSNGTGTDMTIKAVNQNGTVIGIGAGEIISGSPGTPTGLYITADNGHQGIFASAGDEAAILAQTDNGGPAIEGWVLSGNGRSGYFRGGSGVLIEDGLETDDIEITGELIAFGSAGNSGDVLTSTGGTIQWSSSAASKWTENGSDIYYNNGNVGIGASTPEARLHCSYTTGLTDGGIIVDNQSDSDYWKMYHWSTGKLALYYAGSEVGNFDESSGTYNALSDKRMKENIKSLPSVLDKVKKLSPKKYNYISDEDNKDHIGFIAQDVEKQFPELISRDKLTENGDEFIYHMNYSGFGVLAIKAIQEQQKTIEKQNKINKQQQKAIDELRAELQKIKEYRGHK